MKRREGSDGGDKRRDGDSGRYRVFSNRGRGFFVLNNEVHFGHKKTLILTLCLIRSTYCKLKLFFKL